MTDGMPRFKRDGERYIVYLGDDRIGFARRHRTTWNAVDSTMSKTRDFASRDKAAAWLVREFRRAVKAGEIA
jgi:hypothetical protein